MVLSLLLCAVCVLLCVAVHLGLLLLVYRLTAPRLPTLHWTAVGEIVLAAIIGHLLEVTVFAAGYALLDLPDGGLEFDVWYHSAAAFTSLGDTRPGPPELRVMTAVEALTGLVLITWTASFTFLVMQRSWDNRSRRPRPRRAPAGRGRPNPAVSPRRGIDPGG